MRPFAASPERMAVLAAGAGAGAAILGLVLSYQADTPTGPTIVAVATLAFGVAAAVAARRR